MSQLGSRNFYAIALTVIGLLILQSRPVLAVNPPPPPIGPPAPVLSSIALSGPVNVDEGTTAQYVCTATYSDGSTAAVDAAWSENSSYAGISSSGLLSAGNVSADQSITVSASYGGKTVNFGVTIRYVAPTLSGLTISGPTSVNEQTSTQYTCTANYSDGTSVAVSPSWSDNSSYASISASGLLSAGDVTSDQTVTIMATYGGHSDTHTVTIKYVAPTLSSLAVSGPSSVNEETTAQYSCIANWSDGTTTTVTPSWSDNSGYASISASGLLSAGNVTSDQTVIVTASYGGQSDTHTVTIKYVAPTLSSLTVSGPSSVNEETTAQYSCIANWSDGTTTTVTPSWSDNSSYASISASGLLTAGNIASDQSVTITASYGGKSDTHVVTIAYVAPTLSGITITGPVVVDEESVAQYSCQASWSDGTTTTVTPGWSENSGYASISASGLLSAGNVAADQSVIITAVYGGKSDTHSVTILYAVPPVTLTGLSISGPSEMDENTSAGFTCTASYSDGTSSVVTPSWSDNAAFSTISSSGVLSAGNINADETVMVTASFEGSTASVVVNVRVVGIRVAYPLSGFEGKLVRARLWDEVTQEYTYLGEMVNPDELVVEDMNANQWYWIVVEEYDETAGTWIRVQANWISM